jgi:N-acetylglucosamine-6-phosphate deacetylase
VIIENKLDLLQEALIYDLNGAIIAPGFIELQINGAKGFHFSNYNDLDGKDTETQFKAGLASLADYLYVLIPRQETVEGP